MGWRDYLVDSTLQLNQSNPSDHCLIDLIDLNAGSLAQNLTPLHEHLTEVERQIWLDYVGWANDNGATKEKAEGEATDYIFRIRNVLQARQAAEDYRKRGYVQIYSTVLGKAVYFARDRGVIVPDDHPFFTEQDIATCKGLSRDQAKVLLEAKLILGGQLTSEQSMRGHAQKGEL